MELCLKPSPTRQALEQLVATSSTSPWTGSSLATVVNFTYLASFTESILISKMSHSKWLNCPLSGQSSLIFKCPGERALGHGHVLSGVSPGGKWEGFSPSPYVKPCGGNWSSIYMPAPIHFMNFQIKMPETGRHWDGITWWHKLAAFFFFFLSVLHSEQRHSSRDGQSELLEGPDLLCIQHTDLARKRLAVI